MTTPKEMRATSQIVANINAAAVNVVVAILVDCGEEWENMETC